jgi:5-hydroxyisourate hydrolase-like protein (transthyretin family)
MRQQETVIMGQVKIAAGNPAGLRILVRDRVSGKPVQGAKVELSLLGKNSGPTKLGTFRTDSTGSLADAIQIPEILPGEYQLIVETSSPLGRDQVAKKVEIQHPA